jgi:6-phosphogluconolactonase
VSVDRTGRAVLVANYVGGSVALLPTLAGGALGAPSAVVRHAGRGAHPRQDAPHAHCIVVDPSGRYAVAADLGIDRVRVYRLDAGAGTLASAGEVALPSGAGPRHLAFHPDGRTLYVVNELALTLVAFAWDAGSGTLVERQTVPLLAAPDGMRGSVPRAEWTAADVHVHPSGRFVYASVRGPDVLVVLAVDAASGRLAPVQEIATGGRWPRNFALDASGRLLVVANQRSDDLTSFHVDAATGRLTPTGHRATLAAPVCVRFAPDEAGRE